MITVEDSLDSTLNELAYKCHRLTLMLLFESPYDILDDTEQSRQRQRYLSRFPHQPTLDRCKKLVQVIRWHDFEVNLFQLEDNTLCHVLIVLYLMHQEYLMGFPDNLVCINALANLVSRIATYVESPEYILMTVPSLPPRGIKWPEHLRILKEHPPFILEYHSRHSNKVFPTIEALLHSLNLPKTYPEILTIMPITSSIILNKSITNVPSSIRYLIDPYSTPNPIHIQSTVYKELRRYLDTSKATIMYNLNPDWLTNRTSQDDFSLARKWIYKTLGKLHGQCLIAPSEHTFSKVKHDKIVLSFVSKLNFSIAVVEAQGEVINVEGEVVPYLIDNFSEWMETDIGMAFMTQNNSLQAAKSLRGQQLNNLYVPDTEEIRSDGMKETSLGNGVYFGCMLYTLALQGFDVSKALYLADIYSLLTANKPSLTCPLLLAFAINNIGKCNEDLCNLAKIHLKWTNQMLDDDPRVSPIYWTNLVTPDECLQVAAPLELQQCSLLALGLVFANSRDRGMSRRFLNEFFRRGYACTIDYGAIKQTEAPPVNTRVCYDEGFAFCAGVALGLCNLGAGRESMFDCGIYGRDLLDLFECLKPTNATPVRNDPHYLTPAALIAINLIFMKTNDKTVIEHLLAAQSHQRPVHLQTLFHLTELIVKWNFDWREFVVNGTQFLDYAQQGIPTGQQLYLLNVHAARMVAELIFISLESLGTCSFDLVQQLSQLKSKIEALPILASYDLSHSSRATKQAICSVYDHLLLALSLIQLGTGNADTWRSLRRWWRDPLDFSYTRSRLHHTAIGILCTPHRIFVNTTQRIAFLLLTLWPVDNDPDLTYHTVYNRYLRYWWMMCVEEQVPQQIDLDVDKLSLTDINVLLHGENLDDTLRCLLNRRYLDLLLPHSQQ